MQPVPRTAESIRAGLAARALRAGLSEPTHQHRLRLARHQRRRRLHPRVAQGRQGQPRRLVIGRTAGRRLRGTASRQGAVDGAAGARLQPRGRCGRAAVAACRRRLQHAVEGRIRGQLGSAGRLHRPVRAVGPRGGVVRHAGLRPGRRDLGERRAPRAIDHDLGMECRDGRVNDDPCADRRRCARQASDARARASALRRPWLERQGADRPGLRVAQRDVGEESPAAVQGVARLADEGFGG